VPTEPAINIGDKNYKLRTGLITMVQASPFCGLPSENANSYLAHFLELCDTIVIKYVAPEAIRLCLFPFSLVGKVKQWFYKGKEAMNTWSKCSAAFLMKFFPMGKTNPGGMGEAARIHPSMPSPRDGELAGALELLQWVNTHVEGAPRRRCWWCISIAHHRRATTLIKRWWPIRAGGRTEPQPKHKKACIP
jgi:hypothetical protein